MLALIAYSWQSQRSKRQEGIPLAQLIVRDLEAAISELAALPDELRRFASWQLEQDSLERLAAHLQTSAAAHASELKKLVDEVLGQQAG